MVDTQQHMTLAGPRQPPERLALVNKIVQLLIQEVLTDSTDVSKPVINFRHPMHLQVKMEWSQLWDPWTYYSLGYDLSNAIVVEELSVPNTLYSFRFC